MESQDRRRVKVRRPYDGRILFRYPDERWLQRGRRAKFVLDWDADQRRRLHSLPLPNGQGPMDVLRLSLRDGRSETAISVQRLEFFAAARGFPGDWEYAAN